MKKLVLRLLLFLPILLLIIVINVKVDPARIFKSKDYERKIADALIGGSAVTDLKSVNFDDRALEKFLIQSLKTKKDITVLGSSRVMIISSEMFPGKTLLNNGLSSASLEDFIILYEIYRENKKLPSIIILGVDPWIFNKNNGAVGWKVFDPHYYSKFTNLETRDQFNLKIKPQDLVNYKFQQLISVSYFQDSIKLLWNLHFHLPDDQHWFSLTHQKSNQKATILPDGSRTWDKDEREATLDDVRKHIQEDTSQARNINGFFEMNQGLKLKFLKLIGSMKNDGVRVVLFLPPYHPYAYDYYAHSDQFKIINEVEIFLRNTSKAYGLTLVGSYNPHQLSIPESSFYDEVHLKDDTQLKRIFYQLMMGPGLIR